MLSASPGITIRMLQQYAKQHGIKLKEPDFQEPPQPSYSPDLSTLSQDAAQACEEEQEELEAQQIEKEIEAAEKGQHPTTQPAPDPSQGLSGAMDSLLN